MDASSNASALSTADRMSMSLDDCIKVRKSEMRKVKPQGKKTAKSAKKKAVDDTPASKKKAPQSTAAKTGDLGPKSDANGGISKKPSPGSRAARRAAKRAAAAATATPTAAPAASPSPAAAQSAPTAGCRVTVSNLNTGVTEEDIRELFGAVGPLVSASVKQENRGGRQERCADVVFAQMSHALEAINRYNNVPLDDMPLRISLSTTRGARSRPSGRGQGSRRSGSK